MYVFALVEQELSKGSNKRYAFSSPYHNEREWYSLTMRLENYYYVGTQHSMIPGYDGHNALCGPVPYFKLKASSC